VAHILVINPNSSSEMTDLIRGQLELVRRPDTQLEVVRIPEAPPAIESAQDEAAAVPLLLDVVRAAAERGVDAIVNACFSDPGLDAAREVTHVPVVGIQESAMHLAAQLGDRFAVLVPLARRVPLREHAALRYGLDRRLSACLVLELGVLDTIVNRDDVLSRLVRCSRETIERDGSEVIVLGCAGLGDLAPRLQHIIGVPVIDPNAAALKLCETLVDLGLSHSKARLYSAPGGRCMPVEESNPVGPVATARVSL
jgi:allantoin racemase